MMTALELTRTAEKYIRHKQILSRMCNYRNNAAFLQQVGKLQPLLNWLQQHGKSNSIDRVQNVIALYREPLIKSLPHPDNKSYSDSVAKLRIMVPGINPETQPT